MAHSLNIIVIFSNNYNEVWEIIVEGEGSQNSYIFMIFQWIPIVWVVNLNLMAQGTT